MFLVLFFIFSIYITDICIMDILAELVKLCTYPAPRNPFEVDLDYFRQLTQPDCLLASAAMVACLQKIIVASANKHYTDKGEQFSYSEKIFISKYTVCFNSNILYILANIYEIS